MRIVPAIALTALCASASVAHAQYANVVISGEVKPGVYGRVEFGNTPPPPLVYAQPVYIHRDRRYVNHPYYLHVPPGHAKNWSKHCHQYNACYHPVYFVRSVEYEPNYHSGKGHGKGKGWAKGHDKH